MYIYTHIVTKIIKHRAKYLEIRLHINKLPTKAHYNKRTWHDILWRTNYIEKKKKKKMQ